MKTRNWTLRKKQVSCFADMIWNEWGGSSSGGYIGYTITISDDDDYDIIDCVGNENVG